jgi:hypothetical protein
VSSAGLRKSILRDSNPQNFLPAAANVLTLGFISYLRQHPQGMYFLSDPKRNFIFGVLRPKIIHVSSAGSDTKTHSLMSLAPNSPCPFRLPCPWLPLPALFAGVGPAARAAARRARVREFRLRAAHPTVRGVCTHSLSFVLKIFSLLMSGLGIFYSTTISLS